MSKASVDGSLVLVCVTLLLVVTYTMFKGLGGTNSPTDWFGWHPVLMTLAFPVLMTLGRWSRADGAWGTTSKDQRSKVHGCIMAVATVIAIVGYFCIFMSHLAKGSFFGYDFKEKHWNPDKFRIAHSILGYVVLSALISQAVMGLIKIDAKFKKEPVHMFLFHGTMGKIVMLGGTANMVTATVFWGWSAPTKVCMLTLVAITTAFSTAISPSRDKDDEETKSIMASASVPADYSHA
mmetsp:Transcript_99985/g.158258  ORF Transcript_99985/g.158258 Transcript_99985/m.158258 type:complete len:236 (-) Transcript_99985:97-804(-)